MNFFSNINFLFKLTLNNIKQYFKKPEEIKSDELMTNSINWFGHATTVINLYDKIIITDPVFSTLLGYFKRVTKKPNYIDTLKVDYIILSHGHMDHLSFPSLMKLNKDAIVSYKKLYAAKIVDKLVLESLKECGLTLENAHLSDYIKLYEFQTKFRTKLVVNHIDLSFQKAINTNKLGIEISGNYDGITSSVVMFLWNKPWEEVTMSKGELETYLKENKNIGVYIKDRYFAVQKVSRNWVLKAEFGSSYKSMGVGSASSVIENSVKLKKDKQGNLYISQYTMTWD